MGGRTSTAFAGSDYEDSFSEIPQDVLAAATPRRPTARPSHVDDQSNEDQADDEAGGEAAGAGADDVDDAEVMMEDYAQASEQGAEGVEDSWQHTAQSVASADAAAQPDHGT